MGAALREGCLRCAPAPDAIRGVSAGPVGTCASCGRRWLRLPLFAVSGATGVGKTTATESFASLVPECIRLDGDLLWRHEYWDSEEEQAHYYSTWLRLAVELHQHGRPVILSGAVVPARWEPLPLRAYVTTIHYLALVCDRGVHEARLLGRDAGSEDSDYFAPSLRFNDWLHEHAGSTEPPMDLLDTTGRTAEETASEIASWVRARLGS